MSKLAHSNDETMQMIEYADRQRHGELIPWPDPTPEMLEYKKFLAIWETIKHWDIAVPEAYGGYCGATGNHARAIFDALQQ